MSKSAYHHIRESWKKPDREYQSAMWKRMVEWRDGPSFARVDKPTRLDRARALGYKAKQGVIIVRARTRRGGLNKTRFDGGRKPKRMGVNRITMKQNTQSIAEVRTSKHYPNMEVLNSYWVGSDGKNHYYEVILVDPAHPSIARDRDLNWMGDPSNRRRVLRGKTSAGQRHRGLRAKGKGAEHVRPSVKKSHRRDKDRQKWKAEIQAEKKRQ